MNSKKKQNLIIVSLIIAMLISVVELPHNEMVAYAEDGTPTDNHENYLGKDNGTAIPGGYGTLAGWTGGPHNVTVEIRDKNGNFIMNAPTNASFANKVYAADGTWSYQFTNGDPTFEAWCKENGIPNGAQIVNVETAFVACATGPKDPVTGLYPMHDFGTISREEYEEEYRLWKEGKRPGYSYMSAPDVIFAEVKPGEITYSTTPTPAPEPTATISQPSTQPPTKPPTLPPTKPPDLYESYDSWSSDDDYSYYSCTAVEYHPCSGGSYAPDCVCGTYYRGSGDFSNGSSTYDVTDPKTGQVTHVTVNYYTTVYYYDVYVDSHSHTYYCDGVCGIGTLDGTENYLHLHKEECHCMNDPNYAKYVNAPNCCNFLPYIKYDANGGKATSTLPKQYAPYKQTDAGLMFYPINPMHYNIWDNTGAHFTDWSLLKTKVRGSNGWLQNVYIKEGARGQGESSGNLTLSTVYTAFAQWKPNDYILYYDYNAEQCLYPDELVKDNGWLISETVDTYNNVTGAFLRSDDTHTTAAKVVANEVDRDSKKVTFNYSKYRKEIDLRNYLNNIDASGNIISPKLDIYGDALGTYGRYPVPSMRGYNFMGWSYTEGISSKNTLTYTDTYNKSGTIQYYAESDKTLQTQQNGTKDNYVKKTDTYNTPNHTSIYARWEPILYTITFDYNEDWKRPQSLPIEQKQLGITSQTYNFASYYTNLPVPYKTGYIFMGWYMDEYTDIVRNENGTTIARTNGYCEKCGYACEEHRVKDGVSLVVTANNHTLHAAWKQKEIYLEESDNLTGETFDVRIIRYDDFYGDYYTNVKHETENTFYIAWLKTFDNGIRMNDKRFHEVIGGKDVYYENFDTVSYKGNMLNTKNWEDYSLFKVNGCSAIECYAVAPHNYAHNSSYEFAGWSFDILGLIDQRYLAYNGDKMNSAGVVVKDSLEQGFGDRTVFQIRKPRSCDITLDYCLNFYHGWQYERENWAVNLPDFMYENGNKASGALVTKVRVSQDSTFGSLPTPNREGYIFLGWSTRKINCTNEPAECENTATFTSRDCSTGLYYNGDIRYMVDSSSNVVLSECQNATLYAVWKQKDVVVDLDYNQDYDPSLDNHYCP